MYKTIFLGNIGADAEKLQSNGRDYVRFRVAHTERVGEQSRTVWATCFLSGDGGALLPYLIKGQQVVVIGSQSNNIYSSPKTHRFECGVSINVDHVELCGSSAAARDIRQLSDASGRVLDVHKAFYVVEAEYFGKELYDRNGTAYTVLENGFVVSAAICSVNREQAEEQQQLESEVGSQETDGGSAEVF